MAGFAACGVLAGAAQRVQPAALAVGQARAVLTTHSVGGRKRFGVQSRCQAPRWAAVPSRGRMTMRSGLGPGRSQETESWAERLFAEEPKVLAAARVAAEAKGIPAISLTAHEGKILALLLKLQGTRKAVEVGTLFGYSGCWIASALPPAPEGRLWTFETTAVHAEAAAELFEAYGVADRTTIMLGDAQQRLAEIEGEGPFDAVFIDANKKGYPKYLDWAEKHVRKGGLIVGDNTYYFGQVHRELVPSPEGKGWAYKDAAPGDRPEKGERAFLDGLHAMQEFNRRLADPSKYDSVLVPTLEGMTVARKLF
eukprot:tig00000632_g2741.t1